MRARQITILALLAAGLVGAALAACELNPQPLPPSDPDSMFTPAAGNEGDQDSSTFSGEDAGSVPSDAEDASVDGGTGNSADGGDAGDAGDGGDAGADAEVSE